MSAIQSGPASATAQTTLDDSFLEADDAALELADRSTLEDCSECPRQAAFRRDGRVMRNSFCLDSGNAAHEAIGQAVADYVESRGAASRDDTILLMEQGAADSRPDIQPDVVKAVKPSVYRIAKYLHGIHPANILRFDGGRDAQSGQLSWDMTDLGLRITSEVDLLHAGPSPDVLHEVDWKSGHERWTADKVADSFQFQLHAWLVLNNYPDVQALEVRVWNVRFNSVTFRVLFKRSDLYGISVRIRNAAVQYTKIRGKSPEDCQAWPTAEKCAWCPAAAMCSAVNMPEGSPEQWVDKIVGLEVQADALRKLAAAHVKKTGRDITTASGNCFGLEKPKRSVAPKMYTYSRAAATATAEEAE